MEKRKSLCGKGLRLQVVGVVGVRKEAVVNGGRFTCVSKYTGVEEGFMFELKA